MDAGDKVGVLNSPLTGTIKRLAGSVITIDLTELPKKKYANGYFYESRIIKAERIFLL